MQAKSPDSPCSPTEHELAEAYIRTYIKIAIEEMERVGMPASIIIAQAMLESSYGQSQLAQSANNHFGIKCHKGWGRGEYYHCSDEHTKDGIGLDRSCFRSYMTVEDSYKDHSEFLNSRQHYRFLFESNSIDYKFWAEGLLKAKYASDPAYATKLISIVERYDLVRYDKRNVAYTLPNPNDFEKPIEFDAEKGVNLAKMDMRVLLLEKTLQEAVLFQKEMLELQNDLKKDLQALLAQYQSSNKELSGKVEELSQHIDKQGELIVAVQHELDAVKSVQKHIIKADPLACFFNEDGTPKKQIDIFPTRHRNFDGIFYQSSRRATALGEGQSFEDIAKLYNIDTKELRRFNELGEGEENDLPKGCFIYLEPKASTVSGENGPHTVAAGEDMHSISQRYGVKVSKLYQRNYLKKGEEPVAGEFIFLNESADKKPRIRTSIDETGNVSNGDGFGGGGLK